MSGGSAVLRAATVRFKPRAAAVLGAGYTDFMITDYSGVIVSFAMMKKPVFIYAPDLQLYKDTRGIGDYYDRIPCEKALTNEELVNSILEFDEEYYQKRWSELLEEMNYFFLGESSKKVVEWLKNQKNCEEVF